MRVITGNLKGRKLIASDNLSIRPTTDRVKEYIFNIIGDFVVDKQIVDIFCGSGSLGIEAISRGASYVTFVEHAHSSIQVLKKNLSHLKIADRYYQIVKDDAVHFANSMKSAADLYFMDPPFVYPPLQKLVDTLIANPYFNEKSVLIIEHEINNPLISQTSGYKIFKQKKIGRSLISFIEATGAAT